LAFFQGTILALARKCDTATAAPSLTAAEADSQKARVLELWSLLPAFCSNPADVEVTFPTLSQTLIKAVADKRYPQLVVSLSWFISIDSLFYLVCSLQHACHSFAHRASTSATFYNDIRHLLEHYSFFPKITGVRRT
jgi:hypothetical protein